MSKIEQWINVKWMHEHEYDPPKWNTLISWCYTQTSILLFTGPHVLSCVPIYIRHSVFVNVSLSEISIFCSVFRSILIYVLGRQARMDCGRQSIFSLQLIFRCICIFIIHVVCWGNGCRQLIDSFVRRLYILYNGSIISLHRWTSSTSLVCGHSTRATIKTQLSACDEYVVHYCETLQTRSNFEICAIDRHTTLAFLVFNIHRNYSIRITKWHQSTQSMNIFAIYLHPKITSIVYSSIEWVSSLLWICSTCEVDSLSGSDTMWWGSYHAESAHYSFEVLFSWRACIRVQSQGAQQYWKIEKTVALTSDKNIELQRMWIRDSLSARDTLIFSPFNSFLITQCAPLRWDSHHRKNFGFRKYQNDATYESLGTSGLLKNACQLVFSHRDMRC